MAIEQFDDTSLAMPWSPFSDALTPTSWTPSAATPYGTLAARSADGLTEFATELREIKTEERPWTPVSVGSLAKWPQRCALCVQKDDTLVIEAVPVQGLKALRGIPGKVKKECKEGTAEKIVFEGNPFGTPTLPARTLIQIMAEFYRLGYGLLSGVRCRFGISDQIVMQRTAHPYPHTTEVPKMWGVRMKGSDVWAINAPSEYLECLRATLRHTGPRAIAQERTHGSTQHIRMRRSLVDLSNHNSQHNNNKPYKHIATIASAFCQSLGKAVDMGWRIVGSVSAYSETSDVLMFANESVAACSGRGGRAGTGQVMGLALFPSDDKLRLLILNGSEKVVENVTEYMRENWGANIEQMLEDENYVSMWWASKGSASGIASNNTQPKKHNSSHMMLDIFSHMMNSGFVFLERVRTSPVWGDVMLFQEQEEGQQVNPPGQYFGVVRKGSDCVDVVRPLKSSNAVIDAIQHTIKTCWAPGLKESLPPCGEQSGEVHSFKCRGHPWSGREGSSLLSLFSCQPSPSIRLTLALLDAVMGTGATFCADVTCGWVCDGDMWIFRA